MSHHSPSWACHFHQHYIGVISALVESHQTFTIWPEFWCRAFSVAPECASTAPRCNGVTLSTPALSHWRSQLRTNAPASCTSWKHLVHFLRGTVGIEPSLPTRAASIVHTSSGLSTFLYPSPCKLLLPGWTNYLRLCILQNPNQLLIRWFSSLTCTMGICEI